MSTFEIEGRRVGDGEPCFIIAEAGSNHNNELELALELIDIAAAAGADAVKFQLFRADRIAARTWHDAARIDLGGASTLHELYRCNETPSEWISALRERATQRDIIFLCTPFDEDAADLLDEAGMPAFKIASFELVHHPLLRHVGRKGKPIILSTGLAGMADIEEALEVIAHEADVPVALLHCGINYPLPFEQVNLRAMHTMRVAFDTPVGYSDHTSGVEVPVAAVALGGSFVEKHFTRSRSLPGPDQAFSMEPDELTAMVAAIRNVETAMGTAIKRPTPEELEHLERGRRSLFATQAISEGAVITEDMIEVLRPGVGLAPKHLATVLGRKAARAIPAHTPLSWDDV